MSHVAHTNASCRKYKWITSHITCKWDWCKWVMFYWVTFQMSHVSLQMSHVSLSHIPNLRGSIANVSRFKSVTFHCKWVMFHLHESDTHSPSHTLATRSPPQCGGKFDANWVLFRISHVTHMNESCRTYEGIMSLIWISHVAVWWQLRRKLSAVFRQVGPLDVGRCV